MIIFLVILIVLGPKRIPEFAKKAGRVMRYIKRATDDIKAEINKETDEVQKPFKSAYQSANAFSENAHKALKSTLEDLNQERIAAKESENKESEIKNDDKADLKNYTKSSEKQ